MSDVIDIIKQYAPTIAAAFGGPLAGVATSFLEDKLGIKSGTVDSMKAIISGMSPEAMSQLTQHEDDFKLQLAKLGYDSLDKIEELNAAVVESVNTTMQVEAKSDHWPTYSWRPAIGFSFAAYITSLWFLPLFHVVPVVLTEATIMAIGGILGVASYFRGKAQADPNVNTDNRG